MHTVATYSAKAYRETSQATWVAHGPGYIWDSPVGKVEVRKIGAYWFNRIDGDSLDRFNPRNGSPQQRGGSNTAWQAKASAESRAVRKFEQQQKEVTN